MFLLHHVATIRIRLMCLQETYLTECKEKMINDVWSAEYSINNFTDSPHSRGVSILFNPRCDVQIIDTYKCDNARVIILQYIRKIHLLAFKSPTALQPLKTCLIESRSNSSSTQKSFHLSNLLNNIPKIYIHVNRR